MGLLDGKSIIVTGAARGQGAAEARLIAEEGGRVLITDLLDAEGEALTREIGPAARYRRLDVTDEADWAGAMQEATSAFGRLDGLVNNAGYSTTTWLEQLTTEELDKSYRINQRGVALGIKHAVPTMADGGSIVNIGSGASIRATRGKAAYAGAKSALLMITQVAAMELAPRIRVNAVLPGVIATQMVLDAQPDLLEKAMAGTPLGRVGQPEDIANMVIFLLSDRASFVTGAGIPVSGGKHI